MKLTSLEKHAIKNCELSFSSFYKGELTYEGLCKVLNKDFNVQMFIRPEYRTEMGNKELIGNFVGWCPETLSICVNGKRVNCEDLV